jgi:hypothetical protein
LKKKKSKKSKKAKKKAKKTKRGERLGVGVGGVGEEKPVEEESSGKTLMELLELEMRARAIKALLKKEEEGEEDDDEWAADVVVPLATLVENDAIQRPLKAAECVDKYKHRPFSPVHPPTTSQQQLIQGQRTESSSVHQTGDSESTRRSRRPSSSSTAARHVDDYEVSRKSQQPRHYRHHHHYRQERSRSPVARSRGGAEPSAPVKTEAATRLNKSSTPPPSPLLLAAIRPPEPTDTLAQVGRIKSEEPDTARVQVVKGDGATGVVAAQEEEQVEYEEEGIQEVDIELGSGSDDEAHSPSSRY